MTAQISDVVVYRGKPHFIAGVNGEGLFDPAQQGVRPIPLSSACWRGYHCTYEITDGSLVLATVNIGFSKEDRAAAKRGEGPTLFGQVPRRYTVRGVSPNPTTGDVEGGGESWEFSDFRYEGLGEVMPFSGGLLLGDDFVRDLYVHMGFHPAWKFRTVHELLFERGTLVRETDRSTEMAEFRETLAGRPLEPVDPEDHAGIERCVEQCFSLKYKW
jgi:hypothetical protein